MAYDLDIQQACQKSIVTCMDLICKKSHMDEGKPVGRLARNPVEIIDAYGPSGQAQWNAFQKTFFNHAHIEGKVLVARTALKAFPDLCKPPSKTGGGEPETEEVLDSIPEFPGVSWAVIGTETFVAGTAAMKVSSKTLIPANLIFKHAIHAFKQGTMHAQKNIPIIPADVHRRETRFQESAYSFMAGLGAEQGSAVIPGACFIGGIPVTAAVTISIGGQIYVPTPL